MARPVLYSTNPWIAYNIALKYRGGRFFVWCSEYFDPNTAPVGSAASAIAPSSSPKGIYDILARDCDKEDSHSSLIKGYKKTFRRLAKIWLADGSLAQHQHADIVATISSQSWKIWRPMLYIIPSAPIELQDRLVKVPRHARAAYGDELQIVDLLSHEFDAIER